MALLCRLGRHQPPGQAVWNDGLFFGDCDRCGAALIRRPHQGWTQVPPGYAVIWSEDRPGPIGFSAAAA